VTPYGHRWRTVTRPRILARAGGRCERCGFAHYFIDVAHLDQNPANDDETNLAALCRLDHRRHDLSTWRRKCHETRAKESAIFVVLCYQGSSECLPDKVGPAEV